MTDRRSSRLSRRNVVKTLGVAGTFGFAGCLGNSDSGDLAVKTDSTKTSDNSGSTSSAKGLPSKQEGVKEWGRKLNEHAREAGIDWRQFEGTELLFGMNKHPYSSTMEPLLPAFEELTGIKVKFNTFPEDQLWQKLTLDFNSKQGKFDGMMLGLWPSSQYHYAGWVENLSQLINDTTLTDKSWLAMDDYPDGGINALKYKGDELVALPFGIETYGCVSYDRPTFEKLGLDAPTNFDELEDAAKQIAESDKTNKAGVVSRASSTTLSSANWATMAKTLGASWIDREEKVATIASDAGIESLDRFGRMMNKYGPPDIGTYDWYKNNQTYGNGGAGITYHTPAAAGVFTPEQYDRTEFTPPIEGPNGEDPVSATWTWSLGISAYSKNTEAAWLFLQWANSREANYLQSTRQWEGQAPYGHARFDYIKNRDGYEKHGQSESWVNAHEVGMGYVPSDPPPVPVDVPQNMDIMSVAAIAMNEVVTGTKSAKEALNQAQPEMTKHAKKIPDSYLQD